MKVGTFMRCKLKFSSEANSYQFKEKEQYNFNYYQTYL